MLARGMRVQVTTAAAAATDADTLVVGVFEGDEVEQPALAALLASGEAKRASGSLALAHDDGRRWLLAGLGKREDFTHEAARVSAAKAAKRAGELGANHLCWVLPDGRRRAPSPGRSSRARSWPPTASTVTRRSTRPTRRRSRCRS